MMQCSETQIVFGRFRCREHFSLAKAIHLAIMSVQLGNVWTVRFYEQAGMPTLQNALGWFPREVSPRDVFIGELAARSGREAH